MEEFPTSGTEGAAQARKKFYPDPFSFSVFLHIFIAKKVLDGRLFGGTGKDPLDQLHFLPPFREGALTQPVQPSDQFAEVLDA